jgi:hypothetical protein
MDRDKERSSAGATGVKIQSVRNSRRVSITSDICTGLFLQGPVQPVNYASHPNARPALSKAALAIR